MFVQLQRMATLMAAAAIAFAAPIHAQNAGAASHSGLKKTVSVAAFEAQELVLGGATADELNALLVSALLQDGRFVVLERTALADMTNEQTLAQGGAVAAGGAAQPARVLTGSAIIRGTVTKFDPGVHGGSLSVGGLPFLGGGGLGLNAQTAEVAISLRVIDSTTGQILYVGTAKGHASTKSLQVQAHAGGYDWNGGSFLKTPLGEALQDAIRRSVDQIAIGMAKIPWSALVIDCEGANVYLTAGENQGVAEGQVFHVFRKGKVLTDPASGAVLDVILEPVGTIRVQSVRDKTSIATVTSGNAPSRGDVVKAD